MRKRLIPEEEQLDEEGAFEIAMKEQGKALDTLKEEFIFLQDRVDGLSIKVWKLSTPDTFEENLGKLAQSLEDLLITIDATMRDKVGQSGKK